MSESDEPAPDRSTAHVGLVCSHALELRPFIRQLDRRRRYTDGGMKFTGGFIGETIRVAIVEAGSGFAAHRRATEILVKEHQPAWVISAGLSSALSDDVDAGSLSLATSICDTHGQKIDVDCPIPASKHAALHPHLVTDVHPLTPTQKSQLASEWRASVVDTTSLAVGQICESTNRRFLSIRSILDAANEEIPESVPGMYLTPETSTARTSPARWLSGLRKPPGVREWDERAKTLAERLSRFLTGVVRQIGEQLDAR